MEDASKLAAWCVLVVGISLAVRFRNQILHAILRFFTEPGSPYDLACFRVVFFALAILVANLRLHDVEHLANLPRAVAIAPQGLRLLVHDVPRSVELVRAAYVVAIVASVTAAIGLFSRCSAGVFFIAWGYVLTLPSLFGTAGHHHQAIWVAAVLAASRSGDVLAVDAARAARKSARRSELVPVPTPHVRYALPLRVIWLLLGLIYFFPGLYKLFHGGLAWASPVNMRNLIFSKLPLYAGWQPPFSLWRYGWLLWIMGLATLLFELSFIFLILSPRTRWVPAVVGVVFHNMAAAVLRIQFVGLQILYLSFVPWHRLSDRAFARRGRLIVCYDSRSPAQRRTAAVLQVVSLPEALRFADTRGSETAVAGGGRPNETAPLRLEVLVVDGERTLAGFDAFRRLAWRLPWAWAALPLLYVPPIANIARSICARKSRRSEPVFDLPSPSTPHRAPNAVVPVVTVAIILVGGSIWAGSTGVRNGWPFSVYPAFDRRVTKVQPIYRTRVDVVSSTGVRREVDLDRRLAWIPAPYRDSFVYRFEALIAANPSRPDMIHEFWETLAFGHDNLRDVRRVIIYRVVVSTVPGHVGEVLTRAFVVDRACPECRDRP